MSDYLISLCRDGLLLAELKVASARYPQLRHELEHRFPAGEGFGLRIERRRELRRIVEQSPQGVRLLGIEYGHAEVIEEGIEDA